MRNIVFFNRIKDEDRITFERSKKYPVKKENKEFFFVVDDFGKLTSVSKILWNLSYVVEEDEYEG